MTGLGGSMTRYQMLLLAIVLQAATVSIAVFMGTFYFFPDKIVFGAKASILLGLLLSSYHLISPNLSSLFGLRDEYLKFLVRYTKVVLLASVGLMFAAACWMAIMSGTIVERYTYLDAINRAINLMGSNQLALPAPEDLAVAFNLMPQRPEVPFILMRSARLLSFDDRPQNYYAYMQRFTNKVDMDGVVTRFGSFKGPDKLSIDGATQPLPILDPIHALVDIVIDNEHPADHLKWAVETLQKYRNRDEDAELKLWRTILETEFLLTQNNDAQAIERIKANAVNSIAMQIDPQNSGENFRLLSFATDHVYQEALDYLAWLKAGGPEADANLSVRCGDTDEIVAMFQRIIVLRGRLLTGTDLLWWRSPGKLNIYFLFLHLSGQKGKTSASIYNSFDKCPGLIDKIKDLYSAVAFKQFQDPETWLKGTPFSSSFNGSASIAVLRQWIGSGW
jgi:hypothetical protein